MTNQSASLSDSALLTETARAAGVERHATGDLLALLAEVDRRRLYLGLGFPSLFVYCTQALRLSEPAAYCRITAARAAARFPAILAHLATGDVTLTAVTLLASHLTDENYEALLAAARHKSKREVEHLVACLDPQPDVPSVVRRLPMPDAPRATSRPLIADAAAPMSEVVSVSGAALSASLPMTPPPDHRRAIVAPLSADRYLLKVTLSDEAHENLQRLRGLLRHSIPTSDPAAIVERALSVLREQLERTRRGATRRPKAGARLRHRASRHVPAAVKRDVCARDEGRCAFVGTEGRCGETGFLEFHHVVPFARGGPTTAENVELRCRAHNAYEAEREFGMCAQRHPPRTALHQRELCPDRVDGKDLGSLNRTRRSR